MRVVSHPDSSQSHQAHIGNTTYNTRQWKRKQINLTYTKKSSLDQEMVDAPVIDFKPQGETRQTKTNKGWLFHGLIR